jgi:hypothetical protein
VFAATVLGTACGGTARVGYDGGNSSLEDAAQESGGFDANAEASVIDAGTGSVGVLGQSCSPPGMLACAGNEQKLQLLCNASEEWVANGTCSGSQLCDSVPGQNAGTCQDQVPQCVGHDPGYTFCIPSGGPTVETCGPDLVSVTTMLCTAACANGGCVSCEPGYWQCSGDQPQQCTGSGASYSWTNVGPACAGSCVDVNCETGVGACCG